MNTNTRPRTGTAGTSAPASARVFDLVGGVRGAVDGGLPPPS